MKTHFLTLIILLAGFALQAQEKSNSKKDSKYETVEIQTSAICGQCKERLEHDLAFEKGVKSVELNDETKVLTIQYKKGKNNKGASYLVRKTCPKAIPAKKPNNFASLSKNSVIVKQPAKSNIRLITSDTG